MEVVRTNRYGKEVRFLIDEKFKDEVLKHSWYISRYVQTKTKSNMILLHRFIWTLEYGNCPQHLDHINGIKTDNRLENLRECTRSQNQANKGKQQNNTSGFKCVYWSKKDKIWYSTIGFDKTQIYIGTYNDPYTAAHYYNQKALELFGDFAQINYLPS